jgi:septal ring factor EnvC (AmiA/AmiB activator)
MREWIRLSLVLFALNILASNVLNAQSRADLEKQRMDIIKKIEETNSVLKKTKDKKNATTTDLKAIEKQIENRKKLITNINSEIEKADFDLKKLNIKNDSLVRQSEELKKNYQKLLHTNYLSKLSNSKWSYILSSTNLNEMFLRWRYLNQFEDYSQNKLKELSSLSNQIETAKSDISKEKEGKKVLLTDAQQHAGKLTSEQKEKDGILKKLSSEESKLLADLKKTQKDREKLNNKIEAIILAELSKPKPKTSGETNFNNTIAGKSKGKLPWPVSSGFISSKFGEQPHPTIKNVKVTNNGIDISSSNVQAVHAVLDGEVVGVTHIPGYNIMCIIRHGNLYSVYSKLESASVKKDDKIKQGQQIGITGIEEGNAVLHFELWQDKSKVDPEVWLVRK